ncbi:MAG: hypothetical protein GY734_03305 [Herbaspirillum sp.]|nr:hypothetical protein [Herbaspirillum sp.]
MGSKGGGSAPDPKIKEGQALDAWNNYNKYMADATQRYESDLARARAKGAASGGTSDNIAEKVATEKYNKSIKEIEGGASKRFADEYYADTREAQRREIMKGLPGATKTTPGASYASKQQHQKAQKTKLTAWEEAGKGGAQSFYASLGSDDTQAAVPADQAAATKKRGRFGGSPTATSSSWSAGKSPSATNPWT